jgi:hypothetical protein
MLQKVLEHISDRHTQTLDVLVLLLLGLLLRVFCVVVLLHELLVVILNFIISFLKIVHALVRNLPHVDLVAIHLVQFLGVHFFCNL